MRPNITKNLLIEFNNLVNHDIETRIRENEKTLNEYDKENNTFLYNDYIKNIENMMVKFYSSISNILNLHREIYETDESVNEYDFEKIKKTFEKIIQTYKPKKIPQN